jgi:hypothetical protein
MSSVVPFRNAPTVEAGTPECAFSKAANALLGTALRLHRTAEDLAALEGAGGAVPHLANAVEDIEAAIKVLLDTVIKRV